jgi:hypothetical protein
MKEAEAPKADRGTLEIYLRLFDAIHEHQSRLAWSEIVFIVLEVGIFFACIAQVTRIGDRPVDTVGTIGVATVLMSLAIGMVVGTYWMGYVSRLQLRLKLRYFQARYLERKLGGVGEDVLTGDSRFNKDSGALESPDGQETIVFPGGAASRTQGHLVSARRRLLSVVTPAVFFVIFAALFAWVLATYLAEAI